MLNYLQSIVGCQATANPVIDSPICLLLVQLLRAPQQGAFQVLLATILGLLIRHCTLIPPALAESGVSTTVHFSPHKACIPLSVLLAIFTSLLVRQCTLIPLALANSGTRNQRSAYSF